MKKLHICFLFMAAIAFTGCYDREILESKPGDSIDPVTNLNYIINEPEIAFSWTLPSSYPDDILHPVSVHLTVFKDNIQVSATTITDAPTAYAYTGYDSESTYRFIFKVSADVDTDDESLSNLRYSAGVVVVI